MQQSTKSTIKTFDASSIKVGFVVAQFNSEITEAMLKNALNKAKEYSISDKNIKIARVPGAVEIPLLLQTFCLQNQEDAEYDREPTYDILVAIGCVIKGDTPHFDYVCKYACEGIMKVSLENNIPVGFGITTVNTHEQAVERINCGGGALEAALISWKEMEKLSGGN
jgi:6,7-dimethyl-8-ribityllumazine synthase